MILFFSGTGNSEYVADRIGKETGDTVLNLFEKIRAQDHSALQSDKPWVIVTPTYAWRMPRIVTDWLLKTELKGSRDIYFVLTCGGDIRNAGAYLRRFCREKGLEDRGCASVLMPENYIALFKTPSEEEALALIERAEPKITDIARMIKERRILPEQQVNGKDKISSGLVNTVFYPLMVHAGKYYVTDACISCGLCEKACPLGNISLKEGKPVWGRTVPIVWPVSAGVPGKRLSMGRTVRDSPGMYARKSFEYHRTFLQKVYCFSEQCAFFCCLHG